MKFKNFLKKIYINNLQESFDDWDDESMKKFAKTVGKDPKDEGFFEACVLKMSKHMTDEQARGFCAKVKDKAYGSSYWRGKDKSKADVNKETKANQNIS